MRANSALLFNIVYIRTLLRNTEIQKRQKYRECRNNKIQRKKFRCYREGSIVRANSAGPPLFNIAKNRERNTEIQININTEIQRKK